MTLSWVHQCANNENIVTIKNKYLRIVIHEYNKNLDYTMAKNVSISNKLKTFAFDDPRSSFLF